MRAALRSPPTRDMMGLACPRTLHACETLLALCSLVVPAPLNTNLILPSDPDSYMSCLEQVRLHAGELLGSVVCVSHEVNTHT